MAKRLLFDPDTHTYTLDGRRVPSVTEICAPVTAVKYGSVNSALVAQAARRGSLIHEYCQCIDYGVHLAELDVDPALAGGVRAYLAFLDTYRPDWSMIEQPVYTEDYAGTLDRFGTIQGRPCIVDIKTTADMDRLSQISLALQLQGYLGAESPALPAVHPSRRIGVQLRRDGSFRVLSQQQIVQKHFRGADPAEVFDRLLKITKLIGGYE